MEDSRNGPKHVSAANDAVPAAIDRGPESDGRKLGVIIFEGKFLVGGLLIRLEKGQASFVSVGQIGRFDDMIPAEQIDRGFNDTSQIGTWLA